MKTDQIVMLFVALLLGMLLANMLKSVCGCKVVEGGNNGNNGSGIGGPPTQNSTRTPGGAPRTTRGYNAATQTAANRAASLLSSGTADCPSASWNSDGNCQISDYLAEAGTTWAQNSR